MGYIVFESYNAKLADIVALNQSREISHVGVVFEELGGCVTASASGNVAGYYVMVQELMRRIRSGDFQVEVTLSTGDVRKLTVTKDLVIEDGKDISKMFRI